MPLLKKKNQAGEEPAQESHPASSGDGVPESDHGTRDTAGDGKGKQVDIDDFARTVIDRVDKSIAMMRLGPSTARIQAIVKKTLEGSFQELKGLLS